MTTLLAEVNWNDVWSMTGIGFGVVFVVLLLLVFVLILLGKVVSSFSKKKEEPCAPAAFATQPAAETEISVSEVEEAAVAAALYLYLQDMHDEESGVLTIRHTPGTLWHYELNKHLN